MGIEEHARRLIEGVLADLARDGALPPAVLGAAFVVDRPERAEHGDIATNAPLALQKHAQRPPRAIAELLAEPLRRAEGVREVTIAGAGFLNLRLAPAAFHAVLRDVLAAGAGYGRAPAATGERVLLEFVSANPTGPLLISHGRGAILGDAVGTLLEAVGHRVTREYHVNDFGNQVRLLGESVRALLEGRPTPEGGYGADYVKELAAWLSANAGDAVADPDPQPLARAAVMGRFPGMLAEAAALREPHRIVFYVQELSQAFQSYFTRRRDDPVLPQEKHTREPGWEARWDREKTRARLLWIEAIRTVYGASLRLLGISALPRMVRLEDGAGDRSDVNRGGAARATEDDEEAGA